MDDGRLRDEARAARTSSPFAYGINIHFQYGHGLPNASTFLAPLFFE
jgi:hypothetical protein